MCGGLCSGHSTATTRRPASRIAQQNMGKHYVNILVVGRKSDRRIANAVREMTVEIVHIAAGAFHMSVYV